MKRPSSFLYSIFSGILLVAAWPTSPLTLLIFFAWIPLLRMTEKEDNIYRYFLCLLLTMFVWNVGTTWWIWNSTAAGAIGAILANSLIMCIPWWGYYIFRKHYGQTAGYFSLLAFWLGFEYIHLNWQLSWPWLTLGNVFATQPWAVQWYEYTGVSGGTLWILLVNILLSKNSPQKLFLFSARSGLLALVVVALPLAISLITAPSIIKSTNPENVVIVQPNIDPYSEKFDLATTSAQIEKLISLSEAKVDTNTRLVLWPETALPIGVWQDKVRQTPQFQPVFDFVARHPNLTLQTGIETWKSYGTEKATQTARKIENTGEFYDAFNAAITITKDQPFQFYNKSKLVPGVETLPGFLLWLAPIFEKFGGTTSGYGSDKEAVAFRTNGHPYTTAPVICYESIYGEYLTTYVSKGANLITIMTNDGWWANTPGHRQHLSYARLRAIETRKWIARSANTGISAVIDPTGNIIDSLGWDKTGALKYSIPPEEVQTFYVKHGDYIYNAAAILMVCLLCYHLFFWVKRRFAK